MQSSREQCDARKLLVQDCPQCGFDGYLDQHRKWRIFGVVFLLLATGIVVMAHRDDANFARWLVFLMVPLMLAILCFNVHLEHPNRWKCVLCLHEYPERKDSARPPAQSLAPVAAADLPALDLPEPAANSSASLGQPVAA